MRKYTKALKRGFTLVELMIVVAIIGVLAALAIYGVRKYVTNAKTAEGRTAVGRIAKDASSAYQKERMSATVLGAGENAGSAHSLCGSADPVPSTIAEVEGRKWQSEPTDWGGDATTGWRCLKFSINEPQYFQYGYTADDTNFTAAGVAAFSGSADFGLSMSGVVRDGEVVLAPTLNEVEGEDAADLIEE